MTTLNDFKKKQLAQIHIAKKELGLDDETYRSILKNVANVTSSKDLTALGRARVIKHMTEHGWRANGRSDQS